MSNKTYYPAQKKKVKELVVKKVEYVPVEPLYQIDMEYGEKQQNAEKFEEKKKKTNFGRIV